MSQKIVFLDQYNNIGGGQTILVNLVKFCLDLGYEIEIWIPKGGYIQSQLSSFQHLIKYREINIPQLNNSSKNIRDISKMIYFSLCFSKYIKFLKKVDKVYINGPRLALAGMLTSLFTHKQYFYHVHLIHSPIEKIIFNLAQNLPFTKKVILGSDFIANNYYHSHLVLSRHKKATIFNGFLGREYNHLEFEDRFLEGDQHNDRNRYNIMLHGRISPEKGQDIFLKLAKDFPQHNFYIIGFPSNTEYYHQLREDAPANIIFDKTTNVPELVKKLNIHFSISPSVCEEAFGLSPLEAMACSCISLVSHRGNYVNTAQHTNAVLFDDYQDLRSKLQFLLSNNKQELSQIAYEQYCNTIEKYNLSSRVQQFTEILEK